MKLKFAYKDRYFALNFSPSRIVALPVTAVRSAGKRGIGFINCYFIEASGQPCIFSAAGQWFLGGL